MPVLINNEVTHDFGSGINSICPAHDLKSLDVAFHYNLPKTGFVDEHGIFEDEAGIMLQGIDVKNPETANRKVIELAKEYNALFTSFPYQNKFFKVISTGERVLMRSQKSWFMTVSDKLKAQCLDELSTVKFAPELSRKSSEELYKDYEKIKEKREKMKQDEADSAKAYDPNLPSMYINILEELMDFNDWCISEDSAWGLPIPFFKFKSNGKVLMDQEIIEHFAELVELHGSSDIFY